MAKKKPNASRSRQMPSRKEGEAYSKHIPTHTKANQNARTRLHSRQAATSLRFQFNPASECGEIAKAFFLDCLPPPCHDVSERLKFTIPQQLPVQSSKVLKFVHYIPKSHIKYYAQRYRLFHKFDLGCALNNAGWYSITPEPIAVHVAQRCTNRVVIDAFCGCGGNAIQFARYSSHVIAIDNDLESLYIALINARVYGVDKNITFLYGDYCELIPRLALFYPDVVHLSPPWGGINYSENDQPYNIISHMYSLNGVELYRHTLNLTRNIIYYLPKNIDYREVVALNTMTPCTCNYYSSGQHKQRVDPSPGSSCLETEEEAGQVPSPDSAESAATVVSQPSSVPNHFQQAYQTLQQAFHDHRFIHIFSDLRCSPTQVLQYPPITPATVCRSGESAHPQYPFCDTYHQMKPVSSRPHTEYGIATADDLQDVLIRGEDDVFRFYSPQYSTDISTIEALFLMIHRMEARVEFYVTKYHQWLQSKQRAHEAGETISATGSTDSDDLPDILKPTTTTIATEYERIQAYRLYFSHGEHGNAPPPKKLARNKATRRSASTPDEGSTSLRQLQGQSALDDDDAQQTVDPHVEHTHNHDEADTGDNSSSSLQGKRKRNTLNSPQESHDYDPDYDFEIVNAPIMFDFGSFDIEATSDAPNHTVESDVGDSSTSNSMGSSHTAADLSADFTHTLNTLIGRHATYRDYSKRINEKKQIQHHFYSRYLAPRFHLSMCKEAMPTEDAVVDAQSKGSNTTSDAWLNNPGFTYAYQHTIRQEMMLLELLYRPLPTLAGLHWASLKYSHHSHQEQVRTDGLGAPVDGPELHQHLHITEEAPPITITHSAAAPTMQAQHNPSTCPSLYNLLYLAIAQSSDRSFFNNLWKNYLSEMEHLHHHFNNDNPNLAHLSPWTMPPSASTTTTQYKEQDIQDATKEKDVVSPDSNEHHQEQPQQLNQQPRPLSTYQQPLTYSRDNDYKTLISPTYSPYEFNQQAYYIAFITFLLFLQLHHPTVYADLVDLTRFDRSTLINESHQSNRAMPSSANGPQNQSGTTQPDEQSDLPSGGDRQNISFLTGLFMTLSSSTYLSSVLSDIMRLSELLLGVVSKRFNLNIPSRMTNGLDTSPPLSSVVNAEAMVGIPSISGRHHHASCHSDHREHPILRQQRQCIADSHLPLSRFQQLSLERVLHCEEMCPKKDADNDDDADTETSNPRTTSPPHVPNMVEIELCALKTSVKAACIYFGDLVQRFDTHAHMPQHEGIALPTSSDVPIHHNPHLVDTELKLIQPMVTLNPWD